MSVVSQKAPFSPDFSPATRAWFEQSFERATRVQELGWPALAAGRHALLVAPTGSGKTLAAFLWAIDRALLLPPEAPVGVRVVYVSPLKALVYDIERNLRSPLIGIQRVAEQMGCPLRPVGVDVRTGDTPQRDRQRQVRRPAEILVTTPESLFLMLSSRASATFRTVTTVIVDEIHVFAPSKRGVHLSLSLERLAELAGSDPQRIGLSATVQPLDQVARFLGGQRPVEVVDAAEPPRLELRVQVPVPDMDEPPPSTSSRRPRQGGPLLTDAELTRLEREQASGGWPRGGESSGLWPSIYPQILDLVLANRTTIVFVNSRSLCERLAERLSELWRERRAEAGERLDDGAELVRAHHGSISHERRAEIEEALKAGRLRAIVATSSLELGIDMGAVDLVVLVESPGSVARGLQRVGRAGHGVGELSRGVLFPKFKGDLLEGAVVAERMAAGRIEAIRVPRNPLDVLAQQIVAYCAETPRRVEEVAALVRRADPYHDLSGEVLTSVLDMLSGRYPSDEMADLRPALSWDRGTNTLSARRGARMLAVLNAGTIPDRGLYGVYLGEGGPKLGELDEEMVYESRVGDTFLLGASTWRVIDITRDRVLVRPAPGEPGRMPFWRGDGPGRPIELGRALGERVRELAEMPEPSAVRHLEEAGLDDNAVTNLLGYLGEQREATGVVPSDRLIVVERFRDELGDWRLCILSPFGARVHAPWAMALEQVLAERAGFTVETMYTDDGIVLRLPDVDELPPLEALLPAPEEVEDLIVEQVGSSALFASRFRENAARALLLPRRRRQGRSPLWQQRLRSKNLLAAVRRFPNFPIVLETYRECLRDVFDVPALVELMERIRRREVQVHEVETGAASPFARSLVFAYVANYLYEQDAPLAERRAQALTLDRNLLRELLGDAQLRELLDPVALREVEEELQALAPDRRARDADELHDLLRRLGDLSPAELSLRCEQDPAPWLAALERQRRVTTVRVAGEARSIAAEDAGRYRDALGAIAPAGLPDTFLEPVEAPLEGLLLRFARTRGPFVTDEAARRFGLVAAPVAAMLGLLEQRGLLVRGEIRPGRTGLEWCEPGVLRRIKQRSLARARGEVAPVEARVLARFLPAWHGVGASAGSEAVAPGAAARLASAPERLRQVVDQLEGLPLPWSALSGALLPSRIPGFRAELLDMMAASGELVWVGRGALGPRDGRVALYRRERVASLLRPEAVTSESVAEPRPVHETVLAHLETRGACFTLELERLEALREVPSRELEAVIWDLVWAGLITNDTFMPLRTLAGGAGGRKAASGSAPGPIGWRAGGRRPPLAGGRWSLVRSLIDRGASDTEWAHATAQSLLERYGLVFRETALAEEVTGGFEAIYPVLRGMEEAGRVRRGYFVDGVAGRQFALAGAIDRLRALRADEEHDRETPELRVLAAVDPANVWGALLPWPERRREDGPRPRRVPGAWVVLAGGEPILFLDSGGRGVVTFRALDGGDLVARAVVGLETIAGMQRRRSLRLARIDGVAAGDSDLTERLLLLGAERDGDGLRLSR